MIIFLFCRRTRRETNQRREPEHLQRPVRKKHFIPISAGNHPCAETGGMGTNHQEQGPGAHAIDYSNVRTNWNVYPASSNYESVMVTKRQVVSGVISVPLQRCLNIFGALHEEGKGACMGISTGEHHALVRMVAPFSGDEETKGATEVNRSGGDAVLWNEDCTRGYQIHMRMYASQPSQVFLQSLHACFHEMNVRPWSVLCFVPLGVQGHCQLHVWHEGHAHHRAFKSSITHGWTQKRVEDQSDGDTEMNDALEVPQPCALPIQTCLREEDHGMVACVMDGRFVLDGQRENVTVVTPATMPKRLMKKSTHERRRRKKKKKRGHDENTNNVQSGTAEYTENTCNSSDMNASMKSSIHKSTETMPGRKRSRKPSKPSQGHDI